MLFQILKGKGHSITCHRMNREGVKVYLHSFLTSALDGRRWSTPLPGKKPQDMSPGAPQVRCGRAWRTEYLLHSTRFEPRTVQPVASGKQFKVIWFVSANNIFFFVFLLLGDSPASEFYMPTFRNTLSSIFIGGACVFFLTPHMNMEWCSETSAYKIQTPGNHPKVRI